MNRRQFIRSASLAASCVWVGRSGWAAEGGNLPTVRTPEAARKFKSAGTERMIARLKSTAKNKELAWLFENCFPNALDTSVEFQVTDGKPDTFVSAGATDTMGLRDSSLQVWPYLPLLSTDDDLQQMIAGVIMRQTRCILKDPYANSFYRDESKVGEWKSDETEMKPGVHERKWELDSLCHPIRLGYHYWKTTSRTAPFDAAWKSGVMLTLKTFREQQRRNGDGPYHFQRKTLDASETLSRGGYGAPSKPVGLICSMFRPGGGATAMPFLVPSNYFAMVSMRQAADMLEHLAHDREASNQCRALASEIEAALREHSVVVNEKFGRIYSYEVDGYGNSYCVGDGAVPGLLSLPYISAMGVGDPVYLNTRKLLLSDGNPYYRKGQAGEGIGDPRMGPNRIAPLAFVVQGLTTADDDEVRRCLASLQKTHARTGFIHEWFDADDAKQFGAAPTAAINSTFGDLILKTYKERPYLLNV